MTCTCCHHLACACREAQWAARLAELERQRSEYDCRYAGSYAEMSGSHCPIGDPCQRCRLEAAEERAERMEATARFGALMLSNWWNDGMPGDVDGGDAQELAEKTGLWHQVEHHTEGVECDWCGNEGPCGELTEAGLAALAPPAEKGGDE